MKRRVLSNRLTAGISLIETTVSIFLALTCGLMLAAMIPTATFSKERAKTQNVAISIAQKHMEAVRSLGYARITPQQLFEYGLIDSETPIGPNTYSITDVDSEFIDSPVSSLANGAGWLTIETVANDLIHVTVHVDFSDSKGDRSVQLDTSIANY